MTQAVTILIVTERRQAFWPWLAWQLGAQTLPRARRHLLISAPADERDGLHAALAPVAAEVDFVQRPMGSPSLGVIRQQLLDAVTPIIDDPVAWWDDDDWHDPDRLRQGLLELREVPWVAWTQLSYSTLDGRRTPTYRVPGGIPISTMGWYSELRKAHFPDQKRASDTAWFRELATHSTGLLLHEPVPAMVALRHKVSLNPRQIRAQVDPLWWGRVGTYLHTLHAALQ